MSTPPEELQNADHPQWRQELQRADARAHTHRAIDDIVHQQRIGSFERFLLWLSKTDLYVLALSTQHSRLTLASLGMMVLFTSMLAFTSSFYVVMTTLISPDSPLRWPLGLLLAMIYAFGIMIIDREIVGAVSKKSLLIRLVFALGIATAVSWPVKLKFFEGRIEIELTRMVNEKNADKLQRIDELKRSGEVERRQQRDSIRTRMDSIELEVAELDDEIKRESNIVECGPKCQGFIRQKEVLMDEWKQAESQLASLAMPEALPPRVASEIEQLTSEIKTERNVSYDFLSKLEALARIAKADQADYYLLSTFLFLFFLLLEMVPLALKWSLGKTEYHYYIEARTNINNQKIISITNEFMRTMQNDPRAAFDLPPEVTDILAAHMEDEAYATRREPDLRGLFDRINARSIERQQAAADGDADNSSESDRLQPNVRRPANVPPTVQE